MIKTEYLTIGGRRFVKTYSDEGFMVERDGVRYSEAFDPAELDRRYTETDEPVYELDETEQKAIAYDIITGVIE